MFLFTAIRTPPPFLFLSLRYIMYSGGNISAEFMESSKSVSLTAIISKFFVNISASRIPILLIKLLALKYTILSSFDGPGFIFTSPQRTRRLVKSIFTP